MIISDMKAAPARGYIPGECAKCNGKVFEQLWLLDDAYNVWVGKCPHCAALNYLSMATLRGYSSTGMLLVLPTDEEKEANNLPADTPTSGPCGRPADMKGTQLGTLLDKLENGKPL